MAYHPFRNLGLKILALALASLLWLTVAGEHVGERVMRVPLEFHNIPPDLEIVGDPPTSVDVRVRGSSGVISRLQPGEDVVASLELGSSRPGSRLVHIEEIRVPYGVEVAQVSPATVSLELEKMASRVVPVVPVTEGEPAPGFVVGRVVSDPATVRVQGPESRVRALAEATTEPVVVTGSREGVKDVVTIGLADSAVRLSDPATTATVVVEVLPAPLEREFGRVPVRWRNLASGLRAQILPSITRVTVRGQREGLGGLRGDEIDAFVDLAGLGPGHYNLRVQVEPSQDFGVASLSPAVVDVIIK
jgi:YbbR domain-containing protein